MKHPHMAPRDRSGFTLIELLLVIAIIAILATIVIVAINPARQLSQANNAQRRSNVTTILNAVGQYQIDNSGRVPTGVTTSSKEICQTGVATSSCPNGVDLSALTTGGLYLSSMPTDPGAGTTGTGYYILQTTTTNPRIVVSAPSAELSVTISVTR